MKEDNLFDAEFTWLDAVKILLLVVTLFSTWYVVDILTPDTPLAFVRELAAVGMVEGAFLGFEFATKDAKSKRQVRFATIGFFASLTVIGLFAATSGLLEFGGEVLLRHYIGAWAGLEWYGEDVVKAFSLLVLVVWIVALAGIYRLYSLNDPNKKAELERIALNERVIEESNRALKHALEKAGPVIAIHRAKADVREKFGGELKPDETDALVSDVEAYLNEQYDLREKTSGIPAPDLFTKKEAPSPLGEDDGEH